MTSLEDVHVINPKKHKDGHRNRRTTLEFDTSGWLYMSKASLQKWLSPQKPRKTAEERANEREQQDLEMAMKLSLQEEEKVRAEQMALLSQYQSRRASIERTIPDDTSEELSLAHDIEEDEIHSDPLLSSPLSPSLTRQDQQHNNGGCLSDEDLDDFVQGMLATSSSSHNVSPISNRIRKASGRRGKRSIAEAVAESEDNRRKRPVVCSSSTNTYYKVDGSSLESEFENAGFADSAVGLAWESRGQSRYL